MSQIKCPICENESKRDGPLIICPQCQIPYFNIGEERSELPVFTEEQKAILKTYITRFYEKIQIIGGISVKVKRNL